MIISLFLYIYLFIKELKNNLKMKHQKKKHNAKVEKKENHESMVQ